MENSSATSPASVLSPLFCLSFGVKLASFTFSFAGFCLLYIAATPTELASPGHGPSLPGHHLDTSFVGHFVPLEAMASIQRVPAELSESTPVAPTLASGVQGLRARQQGSGSQQCLKSSFLLLLRRTRRGGLQGHGPGPEDFSKAGSQSVLLAWQLSLPDGLAPDYVAVPGSRQT